MAMIPIVREMFFQRGVRNVVGSRSTVIRVKARTAAPAINPASNFFMGGEFITTTPSPYASGSWSTGPTWVVNPSQNQALFESLVLFVGDFQLAILQRPIPRKQSVYFVWMELSVCWWFDKQVEPPTDWSTNLDATWSSKTSASEAGR